MNTSIRIARNDDIQDIVLIWSEIMQFLVNCNPDYRQNKDGESAFGLLIKRTIDDPKSIIIVYEADGTIVGFCWALIERLPEWFGSEEIGLIRYLAVSETNRQYGIGKKMAKYVIKWFHDMGINRIEVYVLKGIPASTFWEKMGFKVFIDRRFLEI